MADEITKIIKIETTGSEQTVKGLKKEIDSLRDALLNTEKGSEDYKNVLEQLINDQKKLADVMSAGKNEVSAATGSYNALKNEMAALKKVWAEVTDEATRSELGQKINAINNELKEMDASIGNFQRNVGNYASGFANAKQELAALKTQMDNLEVGTEAYNKAFMRAAEITHTLQERQEMLRYSAADLGTQLSNVTAIGAGLMGGFNAIQGVLALTGEKSEELQKTMMKLQAGIAIVQGLQGMEGMTKRIKGLLNGLTEMVFGTEAATAAVAAETTAVGANTAAQQANTVATTTATVATKAFQKALIATGIGAIIVLLGTLIAHWEDLKNMIGLSNEKLDEFSAKMDKIRNAVVGVANAIYQYFLSGVKNAITLVTTLGKVMKDVFTLNFDQIGKDIKDGWKEIGDQTKKGLDVVGNYKEGAAKQQERNDRRNAEKAAKRRKAELEDYIKDMEAQKGADWKYTNEGKKAYDEFFKMKIAGYKKDSKEYKEALREKWAYDREYQEKLKSRNKGSGSKEVVDEYLKEAERIEKRAEDSQKTQIQLATETYEKEKALLEQYGKDTTNLTKEYEQKITEIKRKEEEKRRQEEEKTRQAAEKEARRKAMEALRHSRNNLQNLGDANKAQTTSIELEYSFKEAIQSGKLNYNDIIAKTNQIYEANKEYLIKQAEEYRTLMENVDADDETRLDAKRDYYNTLMEMDNLTTQNMIDNINLQREAVKAQIDMYSDMAKSIGDIFGSIADILQEDIQNKIKNGQITQEEGEKQFEAVKAFQIAQATINTIAGAIAAFMSCQATYPQPYGAIIGAIQAAAVTAAGVAQIAKIRSTQLGGGGTVSTATAAAVQTQPEEYTPQYTANATGESEITKLADSIKDQRVYVVESDITEAQNRSKVRITESTW